MNSFDMIRQRFHVQHLTGAGLARPEDVVAWLGGVQSQDYAGASWSVGQRVAGGVAAAVDEAFNSGRILRTHLMRPTWHFVTPADIRWILALTSARVHGVNGTMYRRLELDSTVLARCHAVLTRALEGGQHLTRLELAARLAEQGIVADGQRLAYIVMHAELDGLICSGPLRGKQHTYALLDERAPATPPLAHEEALAQLTRRFFESHGPATATDYSWWSGLSLTQARAGIDLIASHLASEQVAGRTFWFSASMPIAPELPPVAHLVPEYDESHLAFKGSGGLDLPWTIDQSAWADIWFRPVLIDLRRAGAWQRTLARDAVRVDTNLFTSLDRDQARLLAEAVTRYGQFLGRPARLTTAE